MILLSKQLREILLQESITDVNFDKYGSMLQLTRGTCGTPIKTLNNIVGLKSKLTKVEREIICEQFNDWLYLNKGTLRTYLLNITKLAVLNIKISSIVNYESTNVYASGDGRYQPGIKFSKSHVNYSDKFSFILMEFGSYLKSDDDLKTLADKVNVQLSLTKRASVKSQYPQMFKLLDLVLESKKISELVAGSPLNKPCNSY